MPLVFTQPPPSIALRRVSCYSGPSMMKPHTVVLAFAFSALAAVVAPAAHAGVCVQLDTAHDNLNEQERAGTMTMLVQALQQQGQQVATDTCQGTYVVN